MSAPVSAVFTREQPCGKVEIWNCFFQEGRLQRREIMQARSYIGLNVPKVLIQKNLAIMDAVGTIEYIELTQTGRVWLTKGLETQLKRHPGDRARMVQPTAVVPTSKGRFRRL